MIRKSRRLAVSRELGKRGGRCQAVSHAWTRGCEGVQCASTHSRLKFWRVCLPAVCALNGAGAPTLLPEMHQIMKALRPGLIGPETARYGYVMEWRTSNCSGRPLSMGDTLRLTSAGSATSLQSSAPALLHTLKTHCPRDADPYLNQAPAT